MAGLDNKISNIIGTAIPRWVLRQLQTRSEQGSKYNRDSDNLIFTANKSAWARLVSSVNLGPSDINYFKDKVPVTISKPEDLAKNYVLFAGTSKYLQNNSYGLRAGINTDGAYGILGSDEVKNYGYRPMPGMTEVSVETQGRLGSVRSATIQFKCWDKDQLDIMDALYFKLGFSMFLEWGHTVYYKAGSDVINYSELLSIDPFQEGLNKEAIQERIAKNNRVSEGNYDGMLGVVTNFNYSYNQDGGFDCTLKLMSLGILGDSLKINNSGVLPNLLKEEIKQYNDILAKIEAARIAAEKKKNAANNPPPSTQNVSQELPYTFQNYVNQYTGSDGYSISYPSNKSKVVSNADSHFIIQKPDTWIYAVKSIGGLMPSGDNDNVKNTRIKFNPKNVLEVTDVFKTKLLNTGSWGFNKYLFDTNDWQFKYDYVSRANNESYGILIRTDVKAFIDENYLKEKGIEEILDDDNNQDEYIFVDLLTSATYFSKIIENTNNQFQVRVSNPASAVVSKLKNPTPKEQRYGTEVIFTAKHTKKLKVQKKEFTNRFNKVEYPEPSIEEVQYLQTMYFRFDDSYFISEINTVSSIKQPDDYLAAQKALEEQKQKAAATPPPPPPPPEPAVSPEQIENSLASQSALELTLKAIQLHALNKAIKKYGGLDIGGVVYNLNLWDPKDTSSEGKSFRDQIFSNGVFSPFLSDLIDIKGNNNIKNSIEFKNYIESENPTDYDRLKVQAAYGFASLIMKNKLSREEISVLEPVFFADVLRALVVPYEINQEIIKGTQVNHPVYIPLGLLLMILNHSCTIYDSKKQGDIAKPLVYIDFNPNHNFCLSNTKQLTTNPWVVLIPYEGTVEDFKTLFDPNVLSGNSIKGTKDNKSAQSPLFKSGATDDRLSNQLLPFRYDRSYGGDKAAFRGQLMNVLLNIDYLSNLVQQFSTKDSTNNVYLKQFLDQVIDDINKYTGNFNFLRVAYNDPSNTYQIVDDQLVPPKPGEELISPKDPLNSSTLPLVGTKSIAKALEIKTDMSSKLANMTAISANATIEGKSVLANSGDNLGFINYTYTDRYITNRGEVTGSIVTKDVDTLVVAADQFNTTIKDFYSSINPSQQNVAQATNYFIEKMIKIKNKEFPTRASAMIPVSVNFTTDGITGMSMGQAFTIPHELLPYTYNVRSVDTKGLGNDYVNKVGFFIVGLNHTISQNSWNTSVRANMTFLKDINDYTGGTLQELKKESLKFEGKSTLSEGGGGGVETGTDCGCTRCYKDSYPKVWNEKKQEWEKQYSCAEQVLEPESINSSNFGNGRKYYGSYTFKKGTSDINLSKAKLTALTEAEIIDDTTQNRFSSMGTITSNPDERFFVVHHTGGNPGPASRVYSTFYGRGLPAQYVIDGDAKIHRFMPDGALGWHAGNYNGKSIGVEISAPNDAGVSQAQVNAAVRLIHYLGFKKSQVVGHGEISKNKEATEGQKVVTLIRSL